MDESKYENALQIILHAGNAKSAGAHGNRRRP